MVDTFYLAIQREKVSRYLAEIPPDDRPTRDDLEGYTSNISFEEELAWSELYPELCLWLADYERKRRTASPDLGGPADIGQYNFNRDG